MPDRFRAHLRFQSGSGMAAWVDAQMQQRLAMAFHINEGSQAEERSQLTVDGDDVHIDVFWPEDRPDLAADTIATLTAASVTAWLRPVEVDEDGRQVRSWMDRHTCDHDSDVPHPCALSWEWSLS